jgi:hypothetical protein
MYPRRHVWHALYGGPTLEWLDVNGPRSRVEVPAVLQGLTYLGTPTEVMTAALRHLEDEGVRGAVTELARRMDIPRAAVQRVVDGYGMVHPRHPDAWGRACKLAVARYDAQAKRGAGWGPRPPAVTP